MIESLEAVKAGDEYSVTISIRSIVKTKSDVLTIIRQEGLLINKEMSTKERMLAF
ncbi:MAG: hypothetical protein H8E13_04120 [Actinobacteria bacterium]|nr:hypothetical protein [Actinomycetota bacterium]